MQPRDGEIAGNTPEAIPSGFNGAERQLTGFSLAFWETVQGTVGTELALGAMDMSLDHVYAFG
jgi:hypothetical protein